MTELFKFDVKTPRDVERSFQNYQELSFEEFQNKKIKSRSFVQCYNRKYIVLYLINNTILTFELYKNNTIVNTVYLFTGSEFAEIIHLSKDIINSSEIYGLFFYGCNDLGERGCKLQILSFLDEYKDKICNEYLNNIPSYIVNFFFGSILNPSILRKYKACKC